MGRDAMRTLLDGHWANAVTMVEVLRQVPVDKQHVAEVRRIEEEGEVEEEYENNRTKTETDGEAGRLRQGQ